MRVMLLSVGLMAICSTAVAAELTLFATNGDNGRTFSKVDPATGVATPLGLVRAHDQVVYDIAGDPRPSTTTSLYGIISNGSQRSVIGIGADVGDVRFQNGLPTGILPTALAFDGTNGLMYAISNQGSTSNLYTIDESTGYGVQFIGVVNQALDAIEVDQNGILYGASLNSVVTIDKLTAVATPLHSNLPLNITSLASKPDDNRMFGLGYPGGPDYVLFEIDMATGAVTTIGPSVFRPSGLTFYPVQDPQVPEPGTGVLGLLACGMALVGRKRLRLAR
jgi:hypothetical protein